MAYLSMEILTDFYKESFYQSVTNVNSVKRRIEVSMTVSRRLGRDGHSEQTRFAVERPFRLLKAEKNESKQYI